nr:retinoic acid early transcript 1E [Marmota flaviventris]
MKEFEKIRFNVIEESTHSLCLDFTVKSQSRPGESWCEVQGSVDKTTFLQYDSESNKIKPLGHLGREVNATKTWTQLTQMLRELGQELRTILLDMDLEQKMARGHLTLQAKMSCQLKGKNHIGSFWNFSIAGQPSLCLNVMHMEWTVINPRARGIKEKWENDKELREHLRKVSMGDCSHWLREFSEHLEEMPATTSRVPVTEQSPHNRSVSMIIIGVASGLIIIIFIIIFFFWRKKKDTIKEAVSSSTMNSVDHGKATSSDQLMMARSVL